LETYPLLFRFAPGIGAATKNRISVGQDRGLTLDGPDPVHPVLGVPGGLTSSAA